MCEAFQFGTGISRVYLKKREKERERAVFFSFVISVFQRLFPVALWFDRVFYDCSRSFS